MSVIKTRLALILTLISLGLWLPGLTLPLMHMKAVVPSLLGEVTLFDEQRSVLQSVQGFVETQNYLLAGLILLFGIAVPTVKALAFITLLMTRGAEQIRLERLVTNISKWAMADVFVVGVFIAFLSAQQTGMMQAQLGPGFYFFSTYCLTSLFAVQVSKERFFIRQSGLQDVCVKSHNDDLRRLRQCSRFENVSYETRS